MAGFGQCPLNKPKAPCLAARKDEKDLCNGKPANGMVALPNGTLAIFRGRQAGYGHPPLPPPPPPRQPRPGRCRRSAPSPPGAAPPSPRLTSAITPGQEPPSFPPQPPSPGSSPPLPRRAGHYYWLLNGRSPPTTSPRRIRDGWGIPSPIDAVFSRCNCDGKTFFVKVGSAGRGTGRAGGPGFESPPRRASPQGRRGAIPAELPAAGCQCASHASEPPRSSRRGCSALARAGCCPPSPPEGGWRGTQAMPSFPN